MRFSVPRPDFSCLSQLLRLPSRIAERHESNRTAKMALISARTIITSLSLFHVTLAFFFLTDPATIADQAMVYVLGESMGMVGFLSPPSVPQRRY